MNNTERYAADMTYAELSAAVRTLQDLGYTWLGGEQWKPPLGKKPRVKIYRGKIDVKPALEMMERGMTLREIARELGTSNNALTYALGVQKLPTSALELIRQRAAGLYPRS